MILVERTTTVTADVLREVLSDRRRRPDWLPTADAAQPVDPDHTAGPGASYVSSSSQDCRLRPGR